MIPSDAAESIGHSPGANKVPIGMVDGNGESGKEDATENECQCENYPEESSDFPDVISCDFLNKLQEDWNFMDPTKSHNVSMIHNNRCINHLLTHGRIEIKHRQRSESLLEKPEMELKLIFLFLMKSYFAAVHKWTNQWFESCHTKKITEAKNRIISKDQFFAYIGLELGTSIIKYNAIDQYWSSGLFEGHSTFSNTMSHNQFELIRSLLCFSNPESYNHELASKDPLWHSRLLVEHYIKS